MGLEQSNFWFIRCDRKYSDKCEELYNSYDTHGYFSSRSTTAIVSATRQGWQQRGKKWYCPSCKSKKGAKP